MAMIDPFDGATNKCKRPSMGRFAKYERVTQLEAEVENLKRVIEKVALMNNLTVERRFNLDDIPIGIKLIGLTHDMKHFILNVEQDGYYHNDTKYPSLSAAAAAVTGKRRNGWDFWRTIDGTTAKEAFKRGENGQKEEA